MYRIEIYTYNLLTNIFMTQSSNQRCVSTYVDVLAIAINFREAMFNVQFLYSFCCHLLSNNQIKTPKHGVANILIKQAFLKR